MNEKPIPQPCCPDACRVTAHIPMAHVADVDRSIRFYTLLGFTCDSRFSGPDGVTNFTSLSSGRAHIMFARAGEPVVPSQQAVLFYMYSPDVMSLRMHLLASGLADGGKPPGETAFPFTCPTGRFASTILTVTVFWWGSWSDKSPGARRKCLSQTEVVGRLVPGDINTEARRDARFDGRAIAPPGVRARNANQAARRNAPSSRMQQSITHLFVSR